MRMEYKGISIEGVQKKDVQQIRDAIDFVFINTVTNLEIDIRKEMLKSNDGKILNAMIEVYGEENDPDNDVYVITLCRRKHNAEDGSMWATLVHEMTHYKQYVSGKLGMSDNTCLSMEEYLMGWHEIEAHQQQFAFRRQTEGQIPEDSYFINKYSDMGVTI